MPVLTQARSSCLAQNRLCLSHKSRLLLSSGHSLKDNLTQAPTPMHPFSLPHSFKKAQKPGERLEAGRTEV